MPKSKTIEIDEIVTAGKPAGDEPMGGAAWPDPADDGKRPGHKPSDNPFAEFHKALPWKARLTLRLTQWFVLLRSKSWGKLIIIPASLLALVLAIPLGLIIILLLIIRRMLK